MADDPNPHQLFPDEPHRDDALDERIRSTFRAEQQDLHRRSAAAPPPGRQPQPYVMWAAVAAAAALVAVAGFVFFGNRGDDTVDLDIAGPPIEATPTPAPPPTPVFQSATAVPAPTPAPQPTTALPPTPNPNASPNRCPGIKPLIQPHFVWGVGPDDPDGGLVAHTEPAIDAPITRVLPMDLAFVVPTGGCRVTPNGTPWYEILGPSGPDWVSSSYLQAASPACLRGEQYGALTESGSADEQIFGPLDGWAIRGADRTAFGVGINAPAPYRWYDPSGVEIGRGCFVYGEPGEACATGQVRLIDFTSPEPTFTGDGPLPVRLTGRVYETANLTFVEVGLAVEGDMVFVGYLDPAEASIVPGPCPAIEYDTGPDDLASLPCAPIGQGDNLVAQHQVGTAESTADHVHDIRVEQGVGCTRVVVEFGDEANGDGDGPSARLPEIVIVQDVFSADIRFASRPPTTAFDDPQRVDFDGGVVLWAVDGGSTPYVQVMHRPMGYTTRFLEEPARVVIDLAPIEIAPEFGSRIGPFGQRFVLQRPIQDDLTGPGVIAGEPIEVTGFGRPFEAQGEYRIYRIEAGVNPRTFLDTAEPFFTDRLPTSSWVDGWGTFSVTLPDLGPGTYVALFGEQPPADEVGFHGVGQMFRVHDPDEPVAATYPQAELLPNVELPVESF